MEDEGNNSERKLWAKPEITVLGDIEAITLGHTGGKQLDGTFPIRGFQDGLNLS